MDTRFATILGAVVGIAALVWAAVTVLGLVDRIGDQEQIPAGSEDTIEIDRPGDRVVYYEGPGAARMTGSVPGLGDLTVEVTDPAGADVAVEPYETRLRYRLLDRAGEAIGSFPADTPGTYEVALRDAPGEAAVAVGEGVPVGALLRLAAAFVVMLLAFAGAGSAAVVARRPDREDAAGDVAGDAAGDAAGNAAPPGG